MAKNDTGPALAYHDFYKRNGTDTTFYTEGPSMTRQEFADECDINSIMAKYDGYLSDPMRGMREPMFVDFTSMPDTLLGTMQLVQDASAAFYRLPAVVRREFDNDPVLFTDFASDPANIDQLREWGLAKPKPAEVAPQPAAAPGAGAAPAPGVDPAAPK